MRPALSFIAKIRKGVQISRASLLLAAAVLAVSLGVTYGVWHRAKQDAADKLKAEFDFKVRETIARIEHYFSMYESVFWATQGLFVSSKNVERDEFGTYVSSLQLSKTHPGIQSIGFLRLVPKEGKSRHEAYVRQQGFPGYRITPEGEREFYAPIVMRKSVRDNTQVFIGHDLYSEPIRRAAMDVARDSGSVALSQKLMLFAEADKGERVGFLMFQPVYKSNAVPTSMEDRRSDIMGWIYAPIRIHDLMASLEGEHTVNFDIEIYDGEVQSTETLMYDSDGHPRSIHHDPYLRHTYHLRFANRPLTLAVHSLPAFETRMESGKPKLIAWAGIILSLLLALLTFQLSSGRARALALANRMTRSLRESEARYARVIDGSEQGLWDWNLQTQEFRINPRFQTMLGYENGEMQDVTNTKNWGKYVHPDDLARAWDSIERHCSGQIPSHELEIRCRTKTGEWKWVLTKGRITARDEHGSPLVMSGTHTDISERKAAEAREQRLTSTLRAISEINEAILRMEDESTLFPLVCRIAVEFGGMIHAWVGMPDAENRFVPATQFGKFADRLRNIVIMSTPDQPEGMGPSGIAWRENRPVVANDIINSEMVESWREQALLDGVRALASFPIWRGGAPYAVLSVYSDQAGAFGEEIVRVLAAMSANISFALDNFDHENMRRQTEKALQLTQFSIDNASTPICWIRPDSSLKFANDAACRHFGYSREELLSLTTLDINATYSPDIWDDFWQRLKENKSDKFESVHRAKDGRLIPVEVFAKYIEHEGREYSFAFWTDLTDKKRRESEIHAARIRLQELSIQLIEAQENERKALALELHDDLGQKLTTMNIGLYHLHHHLSGDGAEKAWQQVCEQMSNLIADVRNMSGSLRPSMLDYLGLEPAIRHLLQQQFSHCDISFVFEYVGLPEKLPESIEITAYRVVQESITNIVRHANATSVVVEIAGNESGDELEIVIRDNGKGFDPASEKAMGKGNMSLGLVGMRERISLLGGEFKLESKPGSGTRIMVLIPLMHACGSDPVFRHVTHDISTDVA